MPWSVQDYGCWYVSKELLIFIIFISANLLFAQNDNNDNYVSDYYGYTTGSSIKLKCPENGTWFNIGTQCFKIGTNNGTVQIVNFDDAYALCFSPENNYSQPLNLPNWYKSVDLAKIIYPILYSSNLSAAFQNTSSEIWTGFYFDVDEISSDCVNLDIPYFNCSLYPPLKVGRSDKPIFLYTPLWAKGEPKIPSRTENAISYNIDYTNGDKYGWKVQRQALYLPTVCQTFACFEKDFRCKDNSQCIPHSARCDNLAHCADASDEDCAKNMPSEVPIFTNKIGVIHAPATSCISDDDRFCEWHISQKPGSIIQLNFMDLKMLADDELSVEGFATGETLKLNNNGPFTHLFVDNELRIRYRPSLHNIDKEKSNGTIRGFQLQYSAEETTSCISKFDTWNGVISTPAQLYNGRLYRPLLDCRWVVTKRGSTLLGAQIPKFDLAFGDWLKIYESETDKGNGSIIGMFGHANSPPTAFATHLPYLIFEFHSEKNSPGAGGILIDFQQTCINIFLNKSYGQIESPGFQNEDNRNPFHCSWIIEVPCKTEECGITFYFDVLNLTNKDSITIETNYEKIIIDANALPILSHQTKYHKAILQMHSTQKYFAAQISYSIDCPKPAYGSQVIAKFETFPHVYRSSVDYSCISSPHLIAKKGSCEKGGKWDTLPPDCESTQCSYQNITNGFMVDVNETDGQILYYQCQIGYLPSKPTPVECIKNQWQPPIECKVINCSFPETQYGNISIWTDAFLNATLNETLSQNTTYLSYAYYECKKGSMRGTSAVRICQENEKWTTPEMYCKLPICLITDAVIVNGKIDDVNMQQYVIANSSVNVTCLDGYEIINENNVAICDADGHWVTPLPKCEFSNCAKKSCGNGSPKQVEGENVCGCLCQYGYWQDYNESGPCVDIDECAMNYSLCSYDTTCINGNGNYSCLPNSPNETYAIYTYLENKDKEFPEQSFISYDITVVRKRCTEIILPNVILQPAKSLRLVGEILEIYCTDSQILDTVECRSNAYWNVTPSCPIMKAPTCTPPKVEGLIITPQKDTYTLGQHVEFSCQESNQIIIGPSNTVCTLFDNDTAGFVATPICQKEQCSAVVFDSLSHLQFATAIKDFTKGKTIQLKCEDDYHMICPMKNLNCSFITCQDNLLWSSELPICHSEIDDCNIEQTSDITSAKINYSPGEKIEFHCIQPNYVLSDNSDIFCGTVKSVVTEAAQLKNDMITKNFWNQQWREPRQASVDFSNNDYAKILETSEPYRESIFDSTKDTLRGWDKSNDWIYTNDGWKYSSNLLNINNFLISPMIRVQLDTGTVNVVAENMSNECTVEISYFTANYLISSVPENKFKTIIRLNSSMPYQKATIKIVYSILWIMMKARNCDNVVIKNLDISRISCPALRLGLTYYRSTPTSATDIIATGNCTSQSFSLGTFPQLICSKNGKWRLPVNDYNPSTCYCKNGYIQQGQNCIKKGPICYQCDYGSLNFCSNSTTKNCNIGEACLTRIQKNGEETYIEKDCSASCITNFRDLEKCKNGNELCTLCCGTDYCNALPEGNRSINKRNKLSAPIPSCIDMQSMEIKCQASITVRKIKSSFSEPVSIPWPEIIDNSPDFRISSNLLLNSEKYIFNGEEKEIQWIGIDKHGKSARCITSIAYEDYEEPQIQCPDIHIDSRSGTTSKYVPIKLPVIETKDASAVHLIYSPPNNTVIEIDYPLLVNVTAIDSAGNLAQCQFWYMAVASDCPLWKIDTNQFICTQSENITVCHRRQPCITRELPLDFKAIVCIPGQRWRFVQDVTSANRLSETQEMIRTPYCLEQEASNITLSITFRTQAIQSSCAQIFVSSTLNEMNNFVNRHCPNVGWNFLAKDVDTSYITFNFSTTNPNTESVLLCISEITNSLTRELPQTKIECAPLIKSHTITYHVYCSHGWGANTNLRCEKCPPGYFSIKEVCVPCPLGTYSGSYSSKECLPCEGSTSTINEGAISSEECLPLCGFGYYSSNGLAPCRSCPKGSYQSKLGSTACVHCSFNTTTIKSGTHFGHGCRPQCSPGHYSINSGGTEPCLSCPKGYYQNNFGSEICEKCPDGTTTYLGGASSYEQCLELNCQYTGCQNGGICIEGKCKCLRGFVGYDCSVSLNLCNAAYCLNDAICQVTQNKSVCICKEGFNGTRCETNLSRLNIINTIENSVRNPQLTNTCLSSINSCINGKCNITSGGCDCNEGFYYDGATCVQQDVCQFVSACFTGKCTSMSLNEYSCTCINGSQSSKSACAYLGDCDTNNDCNNGSCQKYINAGLLYGKCFCDERYTGTHCDVELNPCQDKPETCLKCVEFGSDLYCDCDRGLYGEYCEVRIDPCYSEKLEYYCYNGGICNGSSDDPFCECPIGWKGDRCEIFDNLCDERNCNNNSTCIPLMGNYTCQCLPEYYGPNCEYHNGACINIPESDGGKCGHGNCSINSNDSLEYSCECDTSWSKENDTSCVYPKEICDDNTCVNGECKTDFEANKTVCLCEEGYIGDDCNTTINYCPTSVNICYPGTCNSTTGGYFCDCENDLCRHNPCFNVSCGHGTCIVNGTDHYCSCQLNFYGDECDIPISYCNAHDDKLPCNGQICNDTVNGGYCQCDKNLYGPNCEYDKNRNYDLYFTGRKSSQSIESISISHSIIYDNSFALCLWVRPGKNSAIETNAQSYLRLKEIDSNPFLSLVKNNPNRDPLISITTTSITVNGITRNYLQPKAPGGWYHLCFQTMIEPISQWVLYVNGVPNVTNPGSFDSFLEDVFIVLAPPTGNETFQGEMSFVELYHGVMDISIIATAVSNCLEWSSKSCSDLNAAICWTNYTTVTRFNAEIITIRPGICYFSNCMVGSADCLDPNDKSPPQVVYCPDVKFQQSKEPWVQVVFERDVYDMFTDQSPITSVTSNFRNGQYFLWGQYRIIITATDYNNNTATCEFTLIVYPENADNYWIPDNNTLFQPMSMDTNKSDQIRDISSIKCAHDDYVIAKDYAPFYVCDIMGQWQRYAAALQSDFNIPQCVKSVEGLQTLNGTLTINDNTQNCETLRNEIKDTINKTDVCKKGCEIDVQPCQQRFRRATDGDFSLQFYVATNTSRIAVKPNVVKALEEHFRGAKAEVNKSEIICINNNEEFPVKVENEKNAVCSTVPMGSYWENDYLKDCPKNTYKNFTGPCNSLEECCIECPDGEVTAMPASLSPRDCYKNCSIGNFYNDDVSDCQPCPKGSYQGFPGMRYCDRCTKSTTTNQTGSISIDQCIKCNIGQEIGKDGDCIDCPIGTYGNGTADSCVPCGKGLTTSGNGSNSEHHCNVVSCVPGSQIRDFSINILPELVFAKDGCQYCEQGKYQAGFNQTACVPCGDGLTTLQRNASTFDACVLITDLTCVESADCKRFNESFECISSCKDQICSYHCGLKEGVPINEESQLWWISLLISFFVLLLVIIVVFIVWRKHMLNCCCSLIPSWLLHFFPEKLKTGMPGMRVSTLRRSRPSSMVSIPDDIMEVDEEIKEPENISLPRLALQKTSAKSISNHSVQEEETCLDNHTLNDIRNGLRDFSNEPEPNPLLHKGQENMSSIRQRLPSPKTAEVGLRVQTSHHSLQNQNNFEHVKKENGHSIKTTSSYSKQDVQNSSYSINMSQNINSNSETEVITGPPVLKWLQDKLYQDSQRLTDQSLSMQTDQRTNLDALSSPDWTSFNQFQSSRRSSSSNSDEHNNPGNQFKNFESNNKSKVDEYFNKASEFSRSSMTSAHRAGSFYTRKTRVQPYNSPNLNNVDDDPDAFFS